MKELRHHAGGSRPAAWRRLQTVYLGRVCPESAWRLLEFPRRFLPSSGRCSARLGVGVFGVSDIDPVKNDIHPVKQLHAGVFLDKPLIGFENTFAVVFFLVNRIGKRGERPSMLLERDEYVHAALPILGIFKLGRGGRQFGSRGTCRGARHSYRVDEQTVAPHFGLWQGARDKAFRLLGGVGHVPGGREQVDG